ncbi:UDP-N-acetylmuramyl-tripeptide synthetase [Candidatus Parcubacteria bacterium]|nr:MAG: UDP-N-acetylmuramyl-tripeptide synthetase [Candidatus Parcubacteria bacterium]
MEALLEKLKRTPPFKFLYKVPGLINLYHLVMAFLAALWYGFPSRKLTVIGVTGTKGKTSTCDLIAQILEGAGHRVGLITTVRCKIGNAEFTNRTKQTMPGRFELQRMLRDMAESGSDYAIVETSSEGILQHRHRFISYQVAVFTNLSPEHIERHGSFEKYREAKRKLFEEAGRRAHSIGVYNLDDAEVPHFLAPEAPELKVSYGYAVKQKIPSSRFRVSRQFQIARVKLGKKETEFKMEGEIFRMPLLGEFNVYNAGAAICVALSQGIPLGEIRQAVGRAVPPPGRLEIINRGQSFTVIVDYAHEPMSLEAAYKAARLFRPRRLICLLGSQGGGRDRWKRGAMGEVAARYCDEIVLASEDPYDEDPLEILKDIEKGVLRVDRRKKLHKIPDRREAIEYAISLAKPQDAVLFTGKGGEVWMCVSGGRKVPWNERGVVEGILEKLVKKERAQN